MNIEDSIKTLKEFNKIKINSYAMQFVNISYPDLQEAIESLLTAYEKEKVGRKVAQDNWGQNVRLVEELKAELEKEKEKNKELEKQLQSTYQKQYINDLEAINHSNVSFN